mgnify:CR=1 FL=1
MYSANSLVRGSCPPERSNASSMTVVRDFQPDYVVNFAAETHVDRSIHNAGDFILTDVFGTFVLLEAMRASERTRRFVQISTDEV